MKRIGLLLVGHIDAGSLHVGGDYPELYAELLGDKGIELTTYRCDEGQLPDSLNEQDGWMCSPSRLSVYDNHAWLRDVEQLLHGRKVDFERFDTANPHPALHPGQTARIERDGRLVGFARSLTDFCFCCYLSDLAVDKACQGQGIGKRLIEETRTAAGGAQTTTLLLSAPTAITTWPTYSTLPSASSGSPATTGPISSWPGTSSLVMAIATPGNW